MTHSLTRALGEVLVLGAATIPAAQRLRNEVGGAALSWLLLFAYAVAALWSLTLCAKAADAAAAAREKDAARETRQRTRSRSASRDFRKRSGAELLKSDEEDLDGDFVRRPIVTVPDAAGAPGNGTEPGAAPQPVPVSRSATSDASPRKRRRMYLPGGSVVYIVEGVAAAAVGLVKDPIVGAQKDGARGFVRGVGTGLMGTVTRPARGLYKAGVNTYIGVEGLIRPRGSGNASPPKKKRRRHHTDRAPLSASAAAAQTALNASAAESDGVSPLMPPPLDRSLLPGGGGGGGDNAAAALAGEDDELDPSVPAGSARRRRKRGMAAAGQQLLQRAVWRRGDAAHACAALDASEPAGRGSSAAALINPALASAAAAGGSPAAAAGSGSGGKSSGGGAWEDDFSGFAIGVMLVPLALAAVRSRMLKSGNARLFAETPLRDVGGGGSSSNWAAEMDAAAKEAALSVEYAESMLEVSLFCSAVAVVATAQRLVRATVAASGGGRWDVSKWVLSGNVRLSVVTAVAVKASRHWLLCCWAVVLCDVFLQLLLAPATDDAAVITATVTPVSATLTPFAHVSSAAAGGGVAAAQPLAPSSANKRRLRPPMALTALSLRFGEAVALCQAIALWSCDALLVTARRLNWGGKPCIFAPSLLPCPPMRSDTAVVVQVGLLGTLYSCAALAALVAVTYRPLQSGSAVMNGSGGAAKPSSNNKLTLRRLLPYLVVPQCVVLWLVVWMAPLLRENPLRWLARRVGGGTAFAQLWESGSKLAALQAAFSAPACRLCVAWAVVLAVFVPLAPRVAAAWKLKKTAARKLFHLLAAAMFLPALTADAEFLGLALAVAICALLVLECLRSCDSPPFSAALQRFYGAFIDSRDGGVVCMTHLFLLLGCAAPLWLAPPGADQTRAPAPAYVGIVALGLGDAAAALVGGRFGSIPWPGSRKTFEGSLAMFFATLLPLAVLTSGESSEMGVRARLWDLAWPVTLMALMEALTTQVDNLVLPCFGFALMAGR